MEKYDINNFLNNINAELHLKSRPPEEAYRFIPNEFQICEYNDKKPERTLRRIFEGVYEYLPYEIERLNSLMDEIKTYNKNLNGRKDFTPITFPSNWKIYDSLRFLQATMYKNQKTIELLLNHLEWKKTYFPFTISNKAAEILNNGFIYVHGRDIYFRPILVINARYYVNNMNNYSYNDWLCSVVYFMEYMINNLLIPGQVENWSIITDLNGVSLLSFPSDKKKMMGVLSSNYRCRLYVNFILGMGTVLNMLWKIVKAFLDETSVKKIRFIKKGEYRDIFEFINEEQIEKKYGGKADDVHENFFPPIMPTNKYTRNNEGIISEIEYENYIKQGKLTTISPYYLKRKNDEKMKQENIVKSEKLEIEEKNKFKCINTDELPINDEYCLS